MGYGSDNAEARHSFNMNQRCCYCQRPDPGRAKVFWFSRSDDGTAQPLSLNRTA